MAAGDGYCRGVVVEEPEVRLLPVVCLLGGRDVRDLEKGRGAVLKSRHGAPVRVAWMAWSCGPLPLRAHRQLSKRDHQDPVKTQGSSVERTGGIRGVYLCGRRRGERTLHGIHGEAIQGRAQPSQTLPAVDSAGNEMGLVTQQKRIRRRGVDSVERVADRGRGTM